jgi:hypothetical protein
MGMMNFARLMKAMSRKKDEGMKQSQNLSFPRKRESKDHGFPTKTFGNDTLHQMTPPRNSGNSSGYSGGGDI